MTYERIRLAFLTGGGVGNKFIQINFIYCVKKFLSNEPVDIVVFGHASQEFNNLLMKDADFISEYYSPSEIGKGYQCDVLVQLEFYPNVLMEKEEKIEKFTPHLAKLLKGWRDFMKEPMRQYGVLHPNANYNAYIYGINMGRNVLDSLDVDGTIGVGKKYKWKLELREKSDDLNMFHLQQGKYITLQRGATPEAHIKESPRLWPVKHYQKLIHLLKEKFPDYKIIQLGEVDNSVQIPGVDLNLLGKTTWRTLGIILKYAWLHIDGDCGMVHYRKAIHGGTSVVLFGHTPIEFCGYDDNINVKSDICSHFCARLTNSWLVRCARDCNEPPCMAAITPEMVMERIEKAIEQNLIHNNLSQ